MNRVVRYTDSVWEFEADLRHAELIVEQLGLTDAKSVNTAGVDQTVSGAAGGDEDEPEEDELEPAEATRFRESLHDATTYSLTDLILSLP